jgi:hypothetical protein
MLHEYCFKINILSGKFFLRIILSGNFNLQVTANSVRLVSCTSRELVDQWNAPEGFSVNVASANASQVGIFMGPALLTLWANIILFLNF